MTQSLFNQNGARKYLVARERAAFVRAACAEGGEVGTFCLTLVFTGARLSEALALTDDRIDFANNAIVLETLKRRRRGVYRTIPVPPLLIAALLKVHGPRRRYKRASVRLWAWGRTTAWKRVKAVMKMAAIEGGIATPKSVRHSFGVEAVLSSVALNIIQRWMGHARIETTAIYTNVVGKEERALAQRTWQSLLREMRNVET